MSERVLITGATGTVAGLVAPALAQGGTTVRAMVRSAEKAKGLRELGIEVVEGDYERPDSLRSALDGVQTAFLVTPPHPEADRMAGGFLTVAREVGLPRVVRLSALRAAEDGPTDNTRQHGRTERALAESGLTWLSLRPHFFMQNTMVALRSAAESGVMYWGMGDGKLGMIDVRDIADVAVELLTDDQYDGQALELTGPESIDFHAVARAYGEALGRDVTYVSVPPEAVEQTLRERGAGDWFAQLMRDYSIAYAANWGDFTTDWVERTTGHAPRSIDDFAREVMAPAVGR